MLWIVVLAMSIGLVWALMLFTEQMIIFTFRALYLGLKFFCLGVSYCFPSDRNKRAAIILYLVMASPILIGLTILMIGP